MTRAERREGGRILWAAKVTANQYQLSKAKRIVACLLACQGQSTLTRHELAKVVAIMQPEQWQTVCFTAGVAVADLNAKAAVLALLRGRSIHAV